MFYLLNVYLLINNNETRLWLDVTFIFYWLDVLHETKNLMTSSFEGSLNLWWDFVSISFCYPFFL